MSTTEFAEINTDGIDALHEVKALRTENAALKEAAKAALEYVDNLNEDTPVDPNCKECAEVVYYTVGTEPPPLCWIHLLEKAVIDS